MDYTKEHLAAVRRARASNVRTVRHGDNEVTYKSDAELAAVEQQILADLARQTGGGAIVRHIRVRQAGRGY